MHEEKPEIPADKGLSGLSTGVNKKYDIPVFETLAVLGGVSHEQASGVTIPQEENVEQAKKWVDENRL